MMKRLIGFLMIFFLILPFAAVAASAEGDDDAVILID